MIACGRGFVISRHQPKPLEDFLFLRTDRFDCADLPADSGYRGVTPMALTVRADAGTQRAAPWPIQYSPFTNAWNNGFYR